MRIILGYSLVIFFLFQFNLTSAKTGFSNENLAFSHSGFKLNDFNFVSKNYAIGIINGAFNANSTLILFDKHHLAVDTFQSEIRAENIISESDSTFFLQSPELTQKLLIKNNELYIRGQYCGYNSDSDFHKKALYTLPLEYGEVKILTSTVKRKNYQIRCDNSDDLAENFKRRFVSKRKKPQLSISASENSFFIHVKEESSLIRLDKSQEYIEEINLKGESGNWNIFHDFVDNKTYLVNDQKKIHQLYVLDLNNEVKYLKDIEFIPRAIFDGKMHKAESQGNSYAHYLVPINSDNEIKNHILEEVRIHP